MNIKTTELQKIVNLAIKGCGQNSQIPLTQLFGLRTVSMGEDGNYLLIGSTDTINYFYAKTKVETDENIDVCVNATTFTQLVNKFTTENISLRLTDRYLEVVADGEYKLSISLFDNGEVQTFPKNGNLTITAYPDPIAIPTEKFKMLVAYGKDTLSTRASDVDLNGYYVDDKVLIAASRKQLMVIDDTIGIKKVLRSTFVDLICESEADTIYLYELDDNNMLAIDGVIDIYSSINSPIENYPSNGVKKVVNDNDYNLKCKLNVKQLLNILDRISLMVEKRDADVIELNIINGSLLVSSKSSSGSEVLALSAAEGYEDKIETTNWSGKINCEWLKTQLGTFHEEVIDLFVGTKKSIKLTEGIVSKLICLAE